MRIEKTPNLDLAKQLIDSFQTDKTNNPVPVNFTSVFALDVSGSMYSKLENAAKGLKTLLDVVPDEVVLFEIDTISKIISRNKEDIKNTSFFTKNSTDLNGCIAQIHNLITSDTDKSKKWLVNIFTDGGDTEKRIPIITCRTLIQELIAMKVTFTFTCLKSDSEDIIKNYGVDATNVNVYENNATSAKDAFEKTRSSVVSYSAAMSRGEDVTKSFFTR